MRLLKKLCLVGTITLAAVSLTTGSASAATGDGNMDIVAVGLSVCNVDFTWDSGTGEISDIVHTSPCDLTSLPADLSNSSLNAAFAGGAASVTGSVVIDVGFDCHYSTTSLGAVTGTYSDAGSSPVIRSFAGGPQNVQKTGGLFLCPSPLNSLEFQNGTIEL